MNELPSGDMAIPSSSVGPEVICSGSPSGNRCLQVWKEPPSFELKYIHFPSSDHAAKWHDAFGGPTGFAGELPSKAISRQGPKPPLSFISTTRIDLRSGEGYERCAMAL